MPTYTSLTLVVKEAICQCGGKDILSVEMLSSLYSLTTAVVIKQTIGGEINVFVQKLLLTDGDGVNLSLPLRLVYILQTVLH